MNEIAACFVLYSPDADHHLAAIRAVRAAGARVLVFDNTPDDARAERNRAELAAADADAVYLRAGGNIGLSAAFNHLVRHAQGLAGLDAIVMFDQDSTVSTGLFTQLVQGWRAAEAAGGPVGVYAAYAVRTDGQPYRQRVLDEPVPVPGLLNVMFAPSSFSLMPMASFAVAGLFQDDFFIDQIDVDFCRRCRLAGRPILIDPKLAFPHRIGDGDVRFRGRALVPASAPFRCYFQVRNILLSARRGGVPWPYAAKVTYHRFGVAVLAGLQIGKFRERLRWSFLGLRDGLRGRGGGLPG